MTEQTETERRIEMVREYCRRLIGFFNRQVVISSEARRYVEGKTEAYNKILEILEGKAE